MRTILQRELFDNLKSLRFITLLIVSMLLFSAGSMIFVKRYTIQLNAYYDRVAHASAPEQDQTFDTRGGNTYPRPSTIHTELYAEPSMLMFAVEGGDKNRPVGYRVKPGGTLEPLPAKPRNYAMPDTPEIDWSFIISVIFSLFVILLGYNAFSGEKEQGTLRLTLSNSMSRLEVLIAKYCAVMITLLIPLLAGTIISLLIVTASVPQLLTLNIVSRLLLLFFATLLFFSLITFLTLGLSAVINQSTLVLMVLLGAWVVGIIIPNISVIISEEIAQVPSEYDISIQEKIVYDDIVTTMMKYYLDMSSPDFKGFFPSVQAAQEEMVSFYTDMNRTLRNIETNYNNAMRNRAQTAHMLSKISPVALFRSSVENFAGTDINQEDRFLSDVHAYSRTYDDYIREKVGELVVTPSVSLQVVAWIDDGTKKTTKHIPYPKPREYEGNKADFPGFSNTTHSTARLLNDSLPDLTGLLLWNIVLCLGAFVAFLRADVR